MNIRTFCEVCTQLQDWEKIWEFMCRFISEVWSSWEEMTKKENFIQKGASLFYLCETA